MRNKILAFSLSTTYASLAGALFAGMVRFVGPREGGVFHTFFMITYLLVGGTRALFGPLIGTLGIVWLTQSLQLMEEYRMIAFGSTLSVSGAFLTWMHRNAQDTAPANKRKTSKVTASSEEAKANA